MSEDDDLRAVVFDLDGLITNTEELYGQVGSVLMRRRGLEYETPLRLQLMGRPARDAYQCMIDYFSLPDSYEDLKPHQFTRNHLYPGARLVADTLADSRIRQALRLAV